MVYVPKRSRRGARKPRMRRKRRGLGVKSVKTIARKVVAENRERKYKQFSFINYTLSPYNSGDFNLGANSVSMVCLSPYDGPAVGPNVNLAISQGVQTDERIGSRIEMKKGTIRLYFSPTFYDPTYNTTPMPMLLQVFIGYDRTTGNGQPSATLPDFFEDNGNAQNPVGWAIDTFRKVNKERYVIFNRRTYKIGNAEYFGSANTPAQQHYTNNDFKYAIKTSFDYTKHLIKTVKYNKDNAVIDTPTTRQLWMWWMITPVIGTAIGGSRQINCTAECTIQYTDA